MSLLTISLRFMYICQIQQQDTRINSKLCPKLTIKRVESRPGVFTVNFKFFSVLLLLTLNRKNLLGAFFVCKYH